MKPRDSDLLFGFNAVEAALQSGRRVEKIWVLAGRGRDRVRRLVDRARVAGVAVEEVAPRILDKHAGGASRSTHQGIVARAAPLMPVDVSEIIAACGGSARLLVLDGVEDPRNLGALVRTAAAAGASGVFLPERRSAGPGPTVARAAAGALDRIPVARVGNLVSFLKLLKEKGFWIIGLAGDADRAWDTVDYPPRVAFAVGGEGRGLRRLVRETCDMTVSIPLFRGVESLNVSVAAGICLYEALRQARRSAGKGPER